MIKSLNEGILNQVLILLRRPIGTNLYWPMTVILVLILSENIGVLKEGAEVGEKV